jgi:protein-tyrosine phosphatase
MRKSFRILFVCTGNICRSPFAELLTRHLLAQRLPADQMTRFVIASAGTQAMTGAAMHSLTRDQLPRWGLERVAGERHIARKLDRIALSSADLVLTADREQRAEVVSSHPPLLHSTFCLREFARLLAPVSLRRTGDDPVLRARAAVSTAAVRRGHVPWVDRVEDVIPDPYGRSRNAHHLSADMIGDALRQVLTAMLDA